MRRRPGLATAAWQAAERPRWLTAASAVEYYRLRRAAHAPLEEVAGFQRSRLEAMVSHARRKVPVYRELYADLPGGRVVEPQLLPLVDKQTFRSRPAEERRAGPPPPLTRTLFSSGTSGQPLRVDWSPRASWWQGVLLLRMAAAQGLSPMHRRAILTSADPRKAGGPFGALRRRHVYLSATDSPGALAEAVRALRPHVVFGHGHMLIEVGEAFDGSCRPRVVNPSGEQLTEENRAALRRAYGVEPLDVYASSEQGMVAWQCSAGDLYHVNHEAVLLEVLDDEGEAAAPGSLGELVISGLCNPLMPLLRYRTGDAAVLATRRCRCGYSLPALDQVQGRMMDWLVDDRGKRVAPQRLWLSEHLADGLTLVHRYQVRQSSSGRVNVVLVPRGEIAAETLRRLEASYRRLLGGGTPIEVGLTDRLENEASGKFRTIVATDDEELAARPRS
jgi:phenylacetate-coenzyme A ligase PaaK-like adenylate-forming protein